jgi:hypothetical protein
MLKKTFSSATSQSSETEKKGFQTGTDSLFGLGLINVVLMVLGHLITEVAGTNTEV